MSAINLLNVEVSLLHLHALLQSGKKDSHECQELAASLGKLHEKLDEGQKDRAKKFTELLFETKE